MNSIDRLSALLTIIGMRLMGRLAKKTIAAVTVNDAIVKLPDSRLVGLAIEECKDRCSVSVYHHSCRTYLWAASLAQIREISYDPEELAIASLLHDLELGKTHDRFTKGCHCFAGAGAHSAEAWLASNNVSLEMREAIAEAIALHLNPGVPLALGATSHLLNAGAMADVVGTQIGTISSLQRQSILSSYPRNDFKKEMKALMGQELRHAPKTRAGFLMSIGFVKLVDAAPFTD